MSTPSAEAPPEVVKDTATAASEPPAVAAAPAEPPNPPVPPAAAPAAGEPPKPPEKPLTKAERRRREAEKAAEQREQDIADAVARARPRIQAILEEEGLLFDWTVEVGMDRDGAVRVRKGVLDLVPNPRQWR